MLNCCFLFEASRIPKVFVLSIFLSITTSTFQPTEAKSEREHGLERSVDCGSSLVGQLDAPVDDRIFQQVRGLVGDLNTAFNFLDENEGPLVDLYPDLFVHNPKWAASRLGPNLSAFLPSHPESGSIKYNRNRIVPGKNAMEVMTGGTTATYGFLADKNLSRLRFVATVGVALVGGALFSKFMGGVDFIALAQGNWSTYRDFEGYLRQNWIFANPMELAKLVAVAGAAGFSGAGANHFVTKFNRWLSIKREEIEFSRRSDLFFEYLERMGVNVPKKRRDRLSFIKTLVNELPNNGLADSMKLPWSVISDSRLELLLEELRRKVLEIHSALTDSVRIAGLTPELRALNETASTVLSPNSEVSRESRETKIESATKMLSLLASYRRELAKAKISILDPESFFVRVFREDPRRLGNNVQAALEIVDISWTDTETRFYVEKIGIQNILNVSSELFGTLSEEVAPRKVGIEILFREKERDLLTFIIKLNFVNPSTDKVMSFSTNLKFPGDSGTPFWHVLQKSSQVLVTGFDRLIADGALAVTEGRESTLSTSHILASPGVEQPSSVQTVRVGQ